MKKALITILISIINLYAVAQNTYVPDDNFEQALIDLGYDDVLDDYVLTSNISGITELDVSYSGIQNLTGIEDFTTLTELNCSSNLLTNLDISTNTALTHLYCSYNQLTSLDVSANTTLSLLYCSFNQLTNLDVSANTDLDNLSCGSNQLTSLDIFTNTILTKLDCYANQLTSLDVSANTTLSLLYCSFNQLTNLDVSANTVLQKLWCKNNLLTNLELGTNNSLRDIDCSSNQLTSLDLSAIILLNEIDCSSNQLTNLDVSANFVLNSLGCYDNQLTSLDISANTVLSYLSCYSNQLTSLDARNGNNTWIYNFNSTDNPNLKCIFVDDKDASYLSNWDIDPSSTFVETEAECDAIDMENIVKEKCNIIYPNPTDGIIFINFTVNKIQNLIISDITGKKIIQETVMHQNERIDLSDLESGVYIISIQTDKLIITSKIIKR